MPKPVTPIESKVEPNPSLEKHTRRVFTPEYKLSIIQQADACKHGELGALLRREKLYSNQLAQWRRELAEDGLAGLSKSAPGPVPKKTAEQKRIEQLEKEVERLHHQMKVKDGCLMLQKKALALWRNTLRATRTRYHFCGPVSPYRQKRKASRQPRALTADERAEVLAVLTSEEYHDQPPTQVYYSLLGKGIYLCSISTMHRLLLKEELNGERRQKRPPSPQATPRLLATAPNQVWTWDIAKLATKRRGEYLSLYVVMDLYSRHIVAWMLSRKENSALSSQLIAEAYDRYGIKPNSLTLHQDRGVPMTSHCYLDLLGELAITASHSRPRVSNDNAMSEAQFKTMKYQPDYPRRFESYDHAMRWCEDYVQWYNHDHHHSSLGGFTPYQVFSGDYVRLAKTKQSTLNSMYERHPERFSNGRPKVQMPATEVLINPVPADADQVTIEKGVNFPTLQRVIEKIT